jgi:hypothetical protein
MAYTTIDDPSAYFTTTLYTGNGSSIDVTNSANSGNFAPDWLWIKERSATSSHIIFDTNRPVSGGFAKHLHANENAAESGDSSELTAFGSNGFSYGSDGKGNQSSQTYVAWQWKANGGTTSSNSDGDITATVQANTTAGFSIMTWTSNNADNQTIGHGLGAAPEVFWVKIRDATGSWYCYFKAAGATHYLRLNSDEAKVDNVIWGDTHPTSSVITVDTNSLSGSTPTVVSYAFKQIKGYSKFGSYTGNGNADGTFVYTGFKPAWVMIKHSSGTSNWTINDVARDPTNVNNLRLFPNQNVAENSGSDSMDMLSNGFKFRSTDSGNNGSGATYVYMAFAEHPFVSSKGVPVTAR